MLLFYFLFALLFISVRVLTLPPLAVTGITVAIAVCESSMFFLAGRDIAQLRMQSLEDHQDSRQAYEAFRAAAGKKAVWILIFYSILSVPSLWYFKKQGIFQAVRNTIAFNNVPDLCGILASIGILYLLVLVLIPWVDSFKHKWRAAILASLVGYLLVFIPRRIIGYAIIGIFIGGDKFGCVPIATHLIPFFWGVYTVIPGKLSLKDKWNDLVIVLLAGLSVLMGFLHLQLGMQFKHAFLLSAGALGAFFAVAVYSLFAHLGRKLDPVKERIKASVSNTVHAFNEPARGRILSKRNAKNLIIYVIGYTFLFLITAVLVYLPIIQMGKSLVWTGDALSQYIPKLVRFLDYVPQVLSSLAHGNMDFLQYDYGSGLGSPMSITFEPIYWLYLILPKGNIDAVYTFLTMFRFYLAGLSFSALVIYFRRSYLACWAASLAYAFSGFALFAGTRHFTFIVSLIILPLLVVGMERLIRFRKWYLFTIMVAISLLCSYYFLYMNTIVLGIYYVTRILCDKKLRSFKTFIERGLIIVGSYILGCSMGVLSIATHFGSYLSSGRSGGNKLDALLAGFDLFYRDGWISDVFLSSVNYSFTPGYWLKIGSVPLALFGAILLFTKKNRKELRVMFIILTSFCFFPIVAFVFSGFSTITNRWTFIYSVLASYLVALCMDQIQELSRRDVIFLAAVTLYYGLLIYFDERMHFTTMFADLAFLAMTLCLVLMLNHKDIHVPVQVGKVMLAFMTIMVLIFNGSHFLTEKSSNGQLHINYTKFNSLERLARTSLSSLDQIPEYSSSDEFFRSTSQKGDNETNCYSLVNGHNDLATFSSTLTGSVVDYNRMMGNCDWTMVRVMDYNFRTYMNELAAVKYLGFANRSFQKVIPYGYKKVFTDKAGRPIYENKYALPMAYCYDTVLPDSFALDECAVTRQELTMHAAIVDDDRIEECSNINQSLKTKLTSHQLPCDIKYNGIHVEGNTMYFDKKGATIDLTFESEPNSETYVVYFGKVEEIDKGEKDYRSVIVKSEDVSYKYPFRTDTYATGQDQHVFNLGYHKDKIKNCKLTFKLKGSMNFEGLAVYSQPMDNYKDMVDLRKAEVLENIEINDNTVTGDVDLDKDQMLVVTLPYQGGWKAYVDDKEVPIYRANYQYIGLNLSKGKHKVQLHFQIDGLKTALMITGCGMLVFLAIIVFNIVRKRRRVGETGNEGVGESANERVNDLVDERGGETVNERGGETVDEKVGETVNERGGETVNEKVSEDDSI